MNKKSPFEFLKKLKIKDDQLDQTEVSYRNGCGCLGAHIAHTYLKLNFYARRKTYFYRKLNDLGWSNDDIRFTMAYCGTVLYPFSYAKWRMPFSEVLKNLLKIEKPVTKTELDSLFDSKGYDKDGYNRFGYNRNGYDRNGLDHDGL